MIQLLKRMRRREALMALLCAVLVVGQVYFDLRLPDYITELTKLIKTPGSSTGDILSVGGEMLLCTLCSAVLAVGCGYLSARTAAGFSFSVRRDLFHHVMDAGSEEMQTYKIPVPKNMDGVIINIPGYLAGLPEEAYLSEFVAAPTEDIGDDEVPGGEGDDLIPSDM